MRVICFGEVLWDCLPKGLFLGGAPLNVAYHLKLHGVEIVLVSSVGQDFLGGEALERVVDMGLDVSHVHRHPHLPTGTVKARIGKSGDAVYEIAAPVAWDEIPVADTLFEGADAVVYGSLAFRSGHNRDAFARRLKRFSGLKVCDVNLRPGVTDMAFVRDLIGASDLVKLNDEELDRLVNAAPRGAPWEARLADFARDNGLNRLCLTLGSQGACEWSEGSFVREAGRKVEVRDTVGAGDAFTARYLVGLLRGEDAITRVSAACRLGEFVAGCDGAQPAYQPKGPQD